MMNNRDSIIKIRLMGPFRGSAANKIAGKEMNNYVDPANLSGIERSHLKDVFSAIRSVQEAVSLRYQTGRF